MTKRATEQRAERRLTVHEAAEALGTSTDAVRMRARRGTLRSEKGDDGRVYVYVDPSVEEPNADEPSVKSNVQGEGYAELVEDLRDQVGYLRDQLSTRDEELRRKDHLLAALVQRVPELEAPQEFPESSQPVREGYGQDKDTGDRQAASQESQAKQERGFWSRLFGG